MGRAHIGVLPVDEVLTVATVAIPLGMLSFASARQRVRDRLKEARGRWH